MNCNEKELKAKLYNNRAIAHFKLGKMMRVLICIFFPFEAKGCQQQFSEKGDNLECRSYLGLSIVQRRNLAFTPDINEHYKFFLNLM